MAVLVGYHTVVLSATGSSLGTIRTGHPRNPVSIPGKNKRFASFFTKASAPNVGPHSLLLSGYLGIVS